MTFMEINLKNFYLNSNIGKTFIFIELDKKG